MAVTKNSGLEPCSTHFAPATLESLKEKILEVVGLSELFKVLADETRTQILYILSEGEMCTCHLAEVLEMSLPAISHHLRLLRLTRLVRSRREGKMVYYALDDEHVLHLIREAQAHFAEER
ncbi:MAG: winged helix-turn-helix transcriptional regulator [Firmicutes bacterium]|nr:winged helix-turn-helix transcriptional regulator [Dethiobacter sp.]MBS3888119.1 winged helix-turn-helix transcriptional regulator [Bacillota bacterium]MBS4054205.1 winged helix-turn-helix transcriptional regulator [Thermaerobacter sp.]